MEDKDMESRVWQRVMAAPGQSSEDLRPLMHAASETAMAYWHLTKKANGKNKELLQKLYDRARVNLNCLKGIQAMRFGTAGKLSPLPASGEPMQKVLEKCYHRTRRAMTEYTARSAEPEFGAVFLVMSQREQDNAALIAELLGMGEK